MKIGKKIGKSYDPSRQGIEDASYLPLPDSSTYDYPTTTYIIPKELIRKTKNNKRTK
jgi:hypothetical protein